MENIKMDRNMDMVHLYGRMGISILVNGLWGNKMD